MNIYQSHLIARSLSLADSVGIKRTMLERSRTTVDREFQRKRIRKGINNFYYIFSAVPDLPKQVVMLEHGTGVHNLDIQIAFIIGLYRKVFTVDITNHLNLMWIKEAGVFLEFEEEFKSLFGITREELINKVRIIQDSNSIEDYFHRLSIEFIKPDKLQAGFSRGDKIDLWYSQSVLQRIPLKKIAGLFQVVSCEMQKQCVAFHGIDLADIHFNPRYRLYANRIHRFDFLKHGAWVWRLLNCDKYSSQNRLRMPHFDSLFEGIGMSLIKGEYVRHPEDEAYLRTMKLADMFCYLRPSQLAIAQAKVVYRLRSCLDGETSGMQSRVTPHPEYAKQRSLL